MSSLFKTTRRNRLVDKLDKHLARFALKEQQKRADMLFEETAFHPSQIDLCYRALFYTWCGVEQKGALPSPQLQRIFHNGDHMHIRFQNYFRDMGIMWGNWRCLECKKDWAGVIGDQPCRHADSAQFYAEYPLIHKELGIMGRADGVLFPEGMPNKRAEDLKKLLKLPERKTVLELKSMNSHSFSQLRKPKDNHVLQAHCYMMCLDINEVHFLYENKDTQAIKQFVVAKDKRDVRWVTNRIKTFREDYWEQETLPPKMDCNPAKCPFGAECFQIKHSTKKILAMRKTKLKDINASKKEEDRNSIGESSGVDSKKRNTCTAKARVKQLRANLSKRSK